MARTVGDVGLSDSVGPYLGGALDQSAGTVRPASRRLSTYFIISLIGVVGFVGLLVSSAYWPALAMPLRISALAWFFGLGFMRVILVGRRRGRR